MYPVFGLVVENVISRTRVVMVPIYRYNISALTCAPSSKCSLKKGELDVNEISEIKL